MRIVFSRKGFDSSAGGCASPIIYGRPVSLPIPTGMPTATLYEDLRGDFSSLVEDLTKGRVKRTTPCHLDPDLDSSVLPREPGWRGALGQVGAAQSHLKNQGVARGDLFLFWGLFCRAEHKSRWVFVGPREHRLFGWLQIDEIIHLGADGTRALQERPWLEHHPHVRAGWGSQNTLYVAAERLNLEEKELGLPGWGVFPTGLRLTAVGRNPSCWTVPDWLNPIRGGVGMSFHPSSSWSTDDTLQCAGRG
jgi:hypothetical protein